MTVDVDKLLTDGMFASFLLWKVLLLSSLSILYTWERSHCATYIRRYLHKLFGVMNGDLSHPLFANLFNLNITCGLIDIYLTLCATI